jgi:hypothetical protein
LQNKFLAPPKAGCSSFEQLNRKRNELLDMFESILMDQYSKFTNSSTYQRPRDFFDNPNGVQGAHTLLNPFSEPLKMIKMIRDRHADASSIRIIGYPNIDWQGNPDERGDLNNYLKYMMCYSAHVVEWSARINEYCKSAPLRSGRKKRRTTGSDSGSRNSRQQEEQSEDGPEDVDPWSMEHSISIIPAWPRAKIFKYYCKWANSTCPIVMQMRDLQPGSVNQSFACFQLSFGGLPELVTCLIRKFLFFDSENADSDRLDRINIKDQDVQWDPAMLKRYFYDSNERNNLQLVTAGCKLKSYEDILRYVRETLKTGEMTPHCAVKIIMKHIEMSISTLKAMIENGNFVSDMMKQALEIERRMFEQSKDKEPFLFDTLNQFQSFILPSTNVPHMVNPFDFARHMLLRCVVGINDHGQLLNSINLQNKVSHLTSMCAFSAGRINSTIDPIGQGQEIIPCCGTAREYVQNGPSRTEIVMANCPNSGGKDFSILMVNQDHQNLVQLLAMEGKSLFNINIMDNYSETALILASSIQWAVGRFGRQILTVMDPSLSMSFHCLTEMRGENTASNLDGLIKHAFPRGGNVSKSNVSTREKEGTREMVTREHIQGVRFVAYCTNQSNPKSNEQHMTLLAVNHAIPPGSTPSMPEGDGASFNDFLRNKFEGKSFPLDETWQRYSAMLAGVQVMSISFMGPMNDAGFTKCEINPAIRAALDFLFLYIQRYYESLFAPSCQKSRFIRLKKVYESRESGLTCFIKTLQHSMENSDSVTVLTRAMADFMCDPISLTNCGNLVYTMLFRCLSWVPCFLTRIFVLESGMPVVPIEDLIELLSMPNPPRQQDEELHRWYTEIREWLMDCVRFSRFCPNPSGGGFCEYVSSNGCPDGSLERNGLFRIQTKKAGIWGDSNGHAVQQAMADEIWGVYRVDLHNSCALSRDSLIPGINDMLNGFFVDFWKLFGIKADSKRHFDFFDVTQHMPFNPMCTPQNGFNALGIRSVWMHDEKDAASAGLGVNCIQLLLLGSLMGDSMKNVIHPQIVSDTARSLVEQLMIRSPKAMTPTNVIEVVNFNSYTCEMQPIVVSSRRKRPDHFMRPDGEQFAKTGDLTEIRSFGRFAPEDILHMGPMFRWLELLDMGDDVRRIPPIIPVCYSLEDNGRPYCAYNQSTGCMGVLKIKGEKIFFETQETPDDTVERNPHSMLLLSWHTDLASLGYILLPMIRRQGACVTVETGPGDATACRIGVIVPATHADEAQENFDDVSLSYKIRTREGHYEYMRALDVMRWLMPIGTKLFLRMESHSAGPLLTRIGFALSNTAKPMYALRGFLNSPNVLEPVQGKVYLTLLCCKNGRSSCETVVVDPWELITALGSKREISHLVSSIPRQF